MGFSVLDSCDKLAGDLSLRGHRQQWNLVLRVVRALQEVVIHICEGGRRFYL